MRIAAVAVVLTLISTLASAQTFMCKGHLTNGYAVTSTGFQTFDARTIVVTLECSWVVRFLKGEGDCEYRFDGIKHSNGFLYQDGGFSLGHLEPWADLSADGVLLFKVSEETNGVGGNEGQRWFRAFCGEAE